MRTVSGSSGGVVQHSTARNMYQHQHNRKKDAYPVATASGEPNQRGLPEKSTKNAAAAALL